MKTSKSFKLLLCLLLPILILVNCDKTDDSPSNSDGSVIKGTFTIMTSLKEEIEINLSAKNFTLEEILNETQVTVNDSEGTEVLNELYPDLPDPITLPVGNYRLFMERTGDVRPNFDNPTYVNTEFHSGGAALAISKDAETEINGTLVLDHIKVVVDFSDEVLQAYPDLTADVFDPDPADATPEAEKLRWTAAENGISGYVFIDNHGADLQVSLSATDGNTGQALSATKTFPGASYNQKYHLSIELSEHGGTGSLSIDPSILPEDVIEEVIPFPMGEAICSGSSMGDYEILKKLLEANLHPDEPSELILDWDLTDTSMASWNGVTLDTEGRVIEIFIEVSGTTIKFIPEFGQLCRLVRLTLHDFHSSTLGVIGQLSNLEYLWIGESTILTLPPEIGMLRNLKELSIGNGQFRVLPPEIGQLSNLERLVLTSLFIETLPPEIGQLTNLKYLDLNSNSASGAMFIPTEIGNLRNLEELYLNASELTSIPEELGQLSNLTFMDLSENPVINIPQVVCDLDDADTEIRLDDGSSGFPADVCN